MLGSMQSLVPSHKHAFCDDGHGERLFVRRVAGSVRGVLFDARAHEPLLDAEWSMADVEAAIRAIAREADEALRDGDWWPVHPLDAKDGTPDVVHGIYFGAAGVLLALHRLARAGLHEPGLDYARLAGDVLESYLRRPEFDGPAPSLWIGEGGIALVAWLLAPTPALADRLAEMASPFRRRHARAEWGSPGMLLIADAMLERTGEERWASAWRAIAEHLMRGGARTSRTSGPSGSTGRAGDPRPRARAGRRRRRARAPPGPAPP